MATVSDKTGATETSGELPTTPPQGQSTESTLTQVAEKAADSNEDGQAPLDLDPDCDESYRIGYDERVYDETNTSDPELNLERVRSYKSLNSEIPDKFSGWGLLSTIGCALMNFNTWGSNSAYALYLQQYINGDMFPGASKIDFGAIGGLTFGSGVILAPFINYSVGFLGLKTTILIGTLVQFLGVMLASFSTKLWQLYCTQGVLQGIGMALVAVPSVVVVPQWFKGGPGGKRNLATGLQTAGSGIGGIVYNIGMEPILTKHGWHWALRTQAIMCLVLNLVAILLIKSRDDKVKPIYKVYDKVVFSTFGSQVMMIWELFTLLGYVVLMYNLGDFTRSMGYGTNQASIVSTMISVGIIYGRPIVGKIADIIGPIQATIIASWLVGFFAFAMWLPCKNFATALVFAMFEGSLMGTIWLTMPTINGAVIGLRKFGIGMSMSWIAVASSGLVSPIIGISLKSGGPPSRTQYRDPNIFVGCCYIGAGLALCVLRGWIIVRNRLATEAKEEDDRLKVRVPIKEGFLNIFKFGNYKV
ncbi:DEKNAAC100309 [Brettanomyces naardenensis]|uniref:DEKNAAC100309 n=1 Tax=Brettanomyces naardenensis TaxID=13370 RepID=A0A448YGC3_BRENA|nr:DEKNAAC100309 [Brettanomyces naardenensis]